MSDEHSPMTVEQAYDALPSDAKWSCSFGYPGEGGFTEFWRTPNGDRWVVTNGKSSINLEWQCRKVD